MQQINKTSNMGQKPSKFPHTGLQAASHNGAILIVSLIILLVVTLIATTNMETSILEERMAGNIEDYNLAFQAAEASLEVGENWLSDQILLPVTSPDGTSTVVWDSEGPANMADTADWWQERTDAWWASNGDSITGLTGVASQPQYVIEQHFTSLQGQSLAIGTGEAPAQRIMHRITARGVGGNNTATVMMQSTYIRPYD